MQTLQELMDSLRPYILEYASEFNIVPDNRNFIHCLNPDHEDKNPSMHYWEENNIFFCFSCGISIDIFSLATLLEGKPDSGPEFIEENVFYLAKKYGLPYEHLQKTLTAEEIKKQTLYRIMKVFSDYVCANKNIDYLNRRNILEETAKKLSIGSVKSFKDCEEYLLKHINTNFAKELIKSIGIEPFKVNEKKLIFIIKDSYGRPCSFVSRDMSGEENAIKYINGLETDIYKKSSLFFGWSDIKKQFNPMDSLLIVEGYIDFVSAYQKGFRNVVALGSASFTDEHIEFLEKNRDIYKVAVALDNDKTGKKRTSSLVERFKNKKLKKTYTVARNKMQQYKDLDEILNNIEEKIKLSEIYENISLFEYELEEIKSGDFDESLVFDKFVTIISQTQRPKERAEQIKILSKYLNNYSYKTIAEQIDYILQSKNDHYKEDVKRVFNYGSKALEKNPENALDILDSLKDEVIAVNEQYNKKKGDIFENGLEFFDNIEQQKTNSDLFNIEFRIPWFDDLCCSPGKYLAISALPNSGKTTIFQQLAVNIGVNKNNGFVFYITTDDSSNKIYSNMIANIMQLPRDYCDNPFFHASYGKTKNTPLGNSMFERYSKGKEFIRRLIENKKLLVVDVKNGSDNWVKVESMIKDLGSKEELKDKFKIMIVDSANKIQVDNSIKDEIGFISAGLKKLGERYGFLSVINFEINKSHNNQKLTEFNLSGSRRMFYDSDAIGFLYNPDRNLQNIHQTKMVWDNNNRKSPVIVSIQSKTKMGNNERNHTPYFYKLDDVTSRIYPIPMQTSEYEYYNKIWDFEFKEFYRDGF